MNKLIIIFMLASVTIPSVSSAASQTECKIWLCLPAGFPSGCGDAHSAMIKRIKKRKSPLPSFGSCAVNSRSNMSYDYSVAALIGEQRVCTDRYFDPELDTCRNFKVIPAHYIKGSYCDNWGDGDSSPRGCIATKRYIDVYIDGVSAGETYFW